VSLITSYNKSILAIYLISTGLPKVSRLKKHLAELSTSGAKSMGYSEFMLEMKATHFLQTKEKSALNGLREVLEYFANMLPEANRRAFFTPRQWLSVNVVNKVNELINQINEKLNAHVHTLHAKLMSELQSKLESNMIERFNRERDSFDKSYQTQAKQLERTLNEFRDKGSEQLTFEQFVSDPKSQLFLTSSELSELEAKRLEASAFIRMLPIANQLIFLSKRLAWIGATLSNRLNELITELSQYQIELSTAGQFSKQVYTYEHFFVRLSSVMAKINVDANVNGLRSVRIYAQHTVIFDVDYTISPLRYSGSDAPDLLVVAPRVIVDKPLVVELSCEYVPPVPGKRKRWSMLPRDFLFLDGLHGAAGLAGRNGGNLIIIAQHIEQFGFLKFVSKGGKGGPGQDGSLKLFKIWHYT
jgi:hypothetical protein